jgi:hypothetical protein
MALIISASIPPIATGGIAAISPAVIFAIASAGIAAISAADIAAGSIACPLTIIVIKQSPRLLNSIKYSKLLGYTN